MILIVYLAIAVVYFTASWVVRRKSGLIGMLLVLLVATVVFAYGMYRYACSLPLACDVGGREAELYYLTHVTRAYAVTGVVGFGAGSVAANMWSERSTRQLPSPKELRRDRIRGLGNRGSGHGVAGFGYLGAAA